MEITIVLTSCMHAKYAKQCLHFACTRFPHRKSTMLKFGRGRGQVRVRRGGNLRGGRCLSPTDVAAEKALGGAAERTEREQVHRRVSPGHLVGLAARPAAAERLLPVIPILQQRLCVPCHGCAGMVSWAGKARGRDHPLRAR